MCDMMTPSLSTVAAGGPPAEPSRCKLECALEACTWTITVAITRRDRLGDRQSHGPGIGPNRNSHDNLNPPRPAGRAIWKVVETLSLGQLSGVWDILRIS